MKDLVPDPVVNTEGITNTPVPPPLQEKARADFIQGLTKAPFLEHGEDSFWHGRAYNGPSKTPKRTWVSDQKPRDDHDAPNWLTASEYMDVPAALRAKVFILAELLKLSRKTVVYSGAGISRGAGIGQAARGGAGSGAKSTDAIPTYTHYALGALSKAGLLHGWVQQNHDGLPQKAGFPQESINEIHGSWYDPSNPVVKYSGTLKEEQYPWMVEDADTADLVLVLGTSLGGLNADQVAIKPAKRSCRGKALGMVIINLQQTEQDGKASLRIFGKSDNILKKLISQLRIEPMVAKSPAVFKQNARVIVPYDKEGNRSETAKMWLDLRDGAEVKLTPGHNVQGSRQPAFMHIGAKKKTNGKFPGPGHGKVMRLENLRVGVVLQIEGTRMMLGQWWIEAAQRGGPPTLPIVNINPMIISE
eukprot:CAMPEP_0185779466 /NCGR_PEP_ID=MMETSP1174-20130828/95886_1 /TAXON_ID=35687 /ORGANISM="Dictyocha speculum, Strain CCMP1381" /LENGTH=416 /DNA_ID=CAMNT_0028468639 /DNA_START=29 /DNA_END=1279 /DNA_ORIENTATION=+